MLIRHYLFASAIVASGLLLVGCTSESNLSSSTSPVATNLHGHPSHGPHHGELVELGDEEYHAELLHDAASVTIYILNGSADQQVAIDAPEITINTLHAGQPEQFSLAASPDTNDSQGKSSRFVSNDANLAARLDEEGAKHRLTLTIEGKSYRGEIDHDHDHRKHDHDGGDHDHEDHDDHEHDDHDHEDHDGHEHDEKDHGHE